MKSNIMWLTVFMIGVISGLLEARSPEPMAAPQPPERTDVSVREKKVQLNGITFEYRSAENNVTREHDEIWKVNGQQVAKEEYHKAYRAAQEAYKASKRAYKEYKRSEKARRVQQISQEKANRIQHINAVGSLRLLELAVADIESAIKKIDNTHLKPFYQFAQNSIVSQEALNNVQDKWLPQARKLIESSSQDMRAIHDLLALVEGMPEKLSDFYLASLEYGVERENNPEALKSWLAMAG